MSDVWIEIDRLAYTVVPEVRDHVEHLERANERLRTALLLALGKINNTTDPSILIDAIEQHAATGASIASFIK